VSRSTLLIFFFFSLLSCWQRQRVRGRLANVAKALDFPLALLKRLLQRGHLVGTINEQTAQTLWRARNGLAFAFQVEHPALALRGWDL
jgi:hypothetical protein